eukprot:Colp12_sorted_trinity150504_noHs@29114
MFSSANRLKERTPEGVLDRFHYLQALVTEFQESDKREHRLQVLANLANFAYDPINYEHMRQLHVLDLFLDCLTEEDDTFVEYGISGLCNLCLDKKNKQHILENDGVALVANCLSSGSEDTVLSAITTLMFLVTKESCDEITASPIKEVMVKFSKSKNPRLSNLAIVFLQDYCGQARPLL